MKTYKKLALSLATLAFTTASSSAALLLTFSEEGGNVVLRTSGTVDLSNASWQDDVSGSGDKKMGSAGFQYSEGFQAWETYHGVGASVLDTGFVFSTSNLNYLHMTAVGDSLFIWGSTYSVFADLGAADDDAEPTTTSYSPVTTVTFTGFNFQTLGIDHHQKNENIYLWGARHGASDSEQVQFRVETAAVPEPSSTALLGLGSIGLLLRRRR